MENKKILVTGGLGLIGHNVVCRLQDHGHKVSITDTQTNYGIIPQDELSYLMAERRSTISEIELLCHRVDISDHKGIDWLMRTYRPDIVIHLASFPRQKVVNANPQLGSRSMSEGLLNLCEASERHNVGKFVYISSSMVYGNFGDQVQEDARCQPQGQYGIMKLAGEWLVRDYTRRGSFDHVIIRPSAVYGPRDVEDRVVSRFMLSAIRGQTLRVNGPNESLDFTYVDDVVNGIVAAALKSQANNKTYNITRGRACTLLDAANLAVRIAGGGRVEIQDRDANFPSRGALNITAARKDLGFDPQVDIEQGFQRYHEWLTNSVYWSKKTV